MSHCSDSCATMVTPTSTVESSSASSETTSITFHAFQEKMGGLRAQRAVSGKPTQPSSQSPSPDVSGDGFAADATDAYGLAAIEQIVRDAVGNSARPIANTSAARPLAMDTPPLSSRSLQEQAHEVASFEGSRRDSFAYVNCVNAMSLTGQPSSQCGTNERSPGCTTIASVGYPEADPSPLWQPLSNQESLQGAPAPPSVAPPSSHKLAKGDGCASESSMGTPTNAAAPAARTTPSSNAVSHYKTKRCRHFDQSGWCPYQHRCVFAHGDREFAFYTSQKGSANNSNSEDGSPTASQLVCEHIERNVQQLVEEYELAVAEASTKAAARNNSGGGPPKFSGPRGSQMGYNSKRPAMPMIGGMSSAQPSFSFPSAASQHHASSAHLMTAASLAPPTPTKTSTSSNSMAQYHALQPQHSPQYHPQQQQQFAFLGQQPVLISTVNGAPAGSTFAMLPSSAPLGAAPQSLHALPSHYQQQPMLFAMPTGTPGVLQLQQQQQQIFFLESPHFNVMASNGGNAGVPAYPTGYTGGPARSFNDDSPARFK
ncbi:hypothetical protein LSCM1_00855 [Leishmania martiniquensis]|uniref:C3H1-type domain-containing protein n=1 Tax=Leishmania martiniquensis TaxID=1580590 RepID=A0A836KDC7_9TRYP|nr:hypothetical protein LSCM1_00855 [Leishmania martiniquensis]